MHTFTPATLMALALIAAPALGAGGKNRLGDEDITVIIDCDEAPGPAWPGAESDD